MKQMNVPAEMQLPVDYDNAALPETVRECRPVVYKDGDAVCVLSGEDPQAGIFGCGDTKEQALADWDKHFNERLSHPVKDDELLQYIQDSRSTSNRKVW